MRNTVFVVLDSMRRDHLGVYNGSIDFTEHIDRIAEESVVYEDAVAQAPWTLPSHASMFTGTYPWEHGATNANAHFETDGKTLAEKFGEQGYTTAAITPNIWVTPHKGLTDGFDEVENFLGVGGLTPLQRVSRAASKLVERLDERVRRSIVEPLNSLFDAADIDTACRSEETIDAAVEFLEEHADEDFFLFVNLMEPHEPYNAPREYLDRHGVSDLSAVPDDNETFFAGEPDYGELRKAYRASVDYTDDLIGRLDRTLSEQGLDEAVLAVAGDHGQALGEDDFFGHQFTVREEVISVPLFVRHPEEPARRDDRLVELRELYWMLPEFAEFGSYDDHGTDAATGGYEFPEVFKRYIDEDRMDHYYRKYRYYRTREEKLVKIEGQDLTASYMRIDLATGTERRVEAEHRRLLDGLEDAGSGRGTQTTGTAEEKEAVKRRLEELGYR
jgi:arylsulfatase A-like enzyme